MKSTTRVEIPIAAAIARGAFVALVSQTGISNFASARQTAIASITSTDNSANAASLDLVAGTTTLLSKQPVVILAGLAANPTESSAVNATLVPVPAILTITAMTDAFGRLAVHFDGGASPLSFHPQCITAHSPTPGYPYDVSNAVTIQLLP